MQIKELYCDSKGYSRLIHALFLAACKADDRGGALIARDEFENSATIALGELADIWPDTILDAAR